MQTVQKRMQRVKFANEKRKADSGSQQRSRLPPEDPESLTRAEKRRMEPKKIKPTTEGKCPYCHKKVQSLEHHIHDKHKGERLPRKR